MADRDAHRREAQGRLGDSAVRGAIRVLVKSVKGTTEQIRDTSALIHALTTLIHALTVDIRAFVLAPFSVNSSDPTYTPGDRQPGSVTQRGFLRVSTRPHGSPWAVSDDAGNSEQPSCTQGSAGGTLKNVCTSITVTLATSSALSDLAIVNFVLRDGASGAGTIKWRAKLSLPRIDVSGGTSGDFSGDSKVITLPCWIEGSLDTAMTLETTAAIPSTHEATVAMSGTTISA
jgi:hypothetical protein